MCELLAANCALPTDISFSMSEFCRRGGATRDNADGFGAAFFEGPQARIFIDDNPGSDSPLAAHLLAHPVKSTNALIHVRKATRGSVCTANSHPFIREWFGRHWAFAHNGHLEWRPDARRWRFQPIGETDSELAFCSIMADLARAFPRRVPSSQEAFETIVQSARALGEHGEFNFILSDGRALYARCGTRLSRLLRQAPFGSATLRDLSAKIDFSERNGQDDKVALIATDPLTVDEPWVPFGHGEICMFIDGELAARA